MGVVTRRRGRGGRGEAMLAADAEGGGGGGAEEEGMRRRGGRLGKGGSREEKGQGWGIGGEVGVGGPCLARHDPVETLPVGRLFRAVGCGRHDTTRLALTFGLFF